MNKDLDLKGLFQSIRKDTVPVTDVVDMWCNISYESRGCGSLERSWERFPLIVQNQTLYRPVLTVVSEFMSPKLLDR
jgi:hypothetical protein